MMILLAQIQDDFRRLTRAYSDRGLLSMGSGAGGAEFGSSPSPLGRDLLLADGLLRNVVGRKEGGVAQITVFGGTQVGKSTTVNVLAGRALAGVHHTAGFTRHAQGFAPPGVDAEEALEAYPDGFGGFVRVPRRELSLDRPLEYSLEAMEEGAALGNSVLWDAPDCDAVDSSLFQRGFVEAVTVADCVVYVTSREKYAVDSILAWVARLRQAGVPVVAVLNMTPVSQQKELLLQDMNGALQRVTEKDPSLNAAEPPLPAVAFDYAAEGQVGLLYGNEYGPGAELRRQVGKLTDFARENLQRRRVMAVGWISSALPGILDPALGDLNAWRSWNERLDRALGEFVADYRRFYLDDPQRYDAFSRVGLEILELLNPPIPGLAKTLTVTRNILSLPARGILAGGKALYNLAFPGGKGARGSGVPYEIATFQEAHSRLLNDLARFAEQQRRAGEGAGQGFWQGLADGWKNQQAGVEQEFGVALAAHRARAEEYIREAARGIYGELAKDPVKLNMLRTGRIGADAAAILVSIKTGGPGDIVHDIVVAPALMSMVEAVSRQLAGNYVELRKEELRKRLGEDARKFVERVYGERLRGLGAESLGRIGLEEADGEALRMLPERLRQLQAELSAL